MANYVRELRPISRVPIQHIETPGVTETTVTPERPGRPTLKPVDLSNGNPSLLDPLRPSRLDDIIGQDALKPMLKRIVAASIANGRLLPHILLVGDSGTGKTTFALALARETGQRCFCLKAPFDMGMLMELRSVCRDGDLIFADEVHLMTSGDRRGRTEACDPESVYTLLEDSSLMTPTGQLDFPKVTWIGATTDVGLMPTPLVNRFPIQPRLEPYSEADMAEMARRSMSASFLTWDSDVPDVLARASRQSPRQLNSYVKTARALCGAHVDSQTALDTIQKLCGTTLDGLDGTHTRMLRHLFHHGRRERRDGSVEFVASCGALATAAGHGRDLKAVYLAESWLITSGLITVQPKGRMLTAAGIERAKQL